MNDSYSYRGYTIRHLSAENAIVVIERGGEVIDSAELPLHAERVIDGWLSAR